MSAKKLSTGCLFFHKAVLAFAGIFVLLALPLNTHGEYVSAAQAQNAVQNWLVLNAAPLGVPLGQAISHVDAYEDEQGAPAYFIVYLWPNGFAIVSAHNMVEPIVGFVGNGKYTVGGGEFFWHAHPICPRRPLGSARLPTLLCLALRMTLTVPAGCLTDPQITTGVLSGTHGIKGQRALASTWPTNILDSSRGRAASIAFGNFYVALMEGAANVC